MKIRKLLKAGLRYVTDKNYRFLINSGFGKYDSMPDEEFIKRKFEACMKQPLDNSSPSTFNEKLQWLKLYDRNPAYVEMVDKVAAKEYVARAIGEEYIVPNLGVWDNPEDIDFSALPEKFAMKCNHNSGLGMCICSDKSKLDIAKVKRELKKGLAQDYYLTGREWPYKDVKRKVFAEKFMSNGESGLTDYKIHCFNGVPKFILVCQDRFSGAGLTEDFLTVDWERIPVKRPNIPLAQTLPEKPGQLSKLLELSEKLSKDIPFVRVDFYIIDNQIYFSELTFFPTSGFAPFEPEEYDEIFGKYLDLPI